MLYFGVPKALNKVVVHHSGGLHKGITNGGSNEFKTTLFQGFTHGVGFWSTNGDFFKRFPLIDFWFTARELPDKGIEASELFLDFKKYLSITDS